MHACPPKLPDTLVNRVHLVLQGQRIHVFMHHDVQLQGSPFPVFQRLLCLDVCLPLFSELKQLEGNMTVCMSLSDRTCFVSKVQEKGSFIPRRAAMPQGMPLATSTSTGWSRLFLLPKSKTRPWDNRQHMIRYVPEQNMPLGLTLALLPRKYDPR